MITLVARMLFIKAVSFRDSVLDSGVLFVKAADVCSCDLQYLHRSRQKALYAALLKMKDGESL